MIDWSKLQPGQRDKYGNFEELCYQIAKGVHGPTARFVSVDDSGGGDGVEFYATFPDGTQWGWQAKFFFPSPRLTGGRKTQIKKSLQKTCDVHPGLTKWFLCMPGELTPNERKWFEETLPRTHLNGRLTVPEGRNVELEFLGDSYFSDKLSEERFAGKRLYFFGELELTRQWFWEQFEKQVRGVREKYERILHTETHDEALVHALLGDGRFADELGCRLGVLREDLTVYDDRVRELVAGKPNNIEYGDSRKPLLELTGDLRLALVELVERLSEVHKHVRHGELDLARERVRALSLEPVLAGIDEYNILKDGIDVSALGYSGPPDQEKDYKFRADRTLRAPASYAAEIYNGAHQIIFLLGYLSKPDLHVLGDPGAGKTHLACWVCDEKMSNGLPAIFLPGKNFVGEGSLETQLRGLLDLPPSYGWRDFVRALDAAAEAHRTRIPIVIDGLNEAVRNGEFSTIWARHLPGFVEEISKTPNVALLTTCRSSYRGAIWSEGGSPENAIVVQGFGFDEVEEVIDKYFAAYKIQADLTVAPLEQFEHPIYLKLFCEAKNPERREWVDVHVGEETLFEVFDQYLARCDAEVACRLDLHPGTPVVSQSLERLVPYLWLHGSRSIPVREAARLVDGEDLNRLRWSSSRTYAMQSEGLVVCRDWLGEGESYLVTYDLMAGYLIARYLLKDNYDDLATFLASDRIIDLLYGHDYRKRHPLHEDIRRSLAALAPKLAGRHLHEITDNEAAISDSVRALFEISAEYVGESSVRLITERFGEETNRRTLLNLSYPTAARPQHPLNTDYWHERLKELPLPERDISWSEHVRRNKGHTETLVRLLEERCHNATEPPAEMTGRLRLMAKYAMWTLTSTAKTLRDKATRALYWYGRRFPEDFFKLVEDSFEIDDPYVPERMLAACYGIAMARRYAPSDRGFVKGTQPKWAEKLYAAMFAPNAPHATTHILARNYARRAIEIATLHHPDLLTAEQLERTKPPYEDGGIREWGQSKERSGGEYRNNHPFNPSDDYPMSRLGRGISKYHSGTPEYKEARANLWWRVYSLGYSLERFGSVDAQISSESHFARRYDGGGGQMEGYGRKYVRIATCELAGYKDDLGLLKSEYDSGHENPLHVDLDPSFPERPSELQLVAGDLLGDRREPLAEWITRGPDLAFEELLEVEELNGERGPWVLLYGDITQRDEHSRRHMFCSLQGVLLDAGAAEEILNAASRAEEIHLDATHIPENHYTYAGEIPWCDTYPPNEPSEIPLNMVTATVARKKIDLGFFRDGDPLSEAELFEVLSRLPGADAAALLMFSTVGAPPRNIVCALKAEGIEVVEREVVVEEECPQTEGYEMTMPVNRHGWESHHSALNPGFGAHTPARQMADLLGLTNRPQTYNLFDPEGCRASVTLEHGGRSSNRQEFLYLRKDLLDHFLRWSGQRLVWATYGERAVYHADISREGELLAADPTYIRYGKMCAYD